MTLGSARAAAWADWSLAALIFAHILVFELLFFFSTRWYTPAVWLWKFAVPVGLFLLFGVRHLVDFRRNWTVFGYTALFVIFSLWILIATLIANSLGDGVVAWWKEVPRLLFFAALYPLFRRRPSVLRRTKQLIVGWGVLALVQYAALAATAGHVSLVAHPELTTVLAGPFGILGNVSSLQFFGPLGIPIPRLSGFWNEPAQAAGFEMAACFLAFGLAAELGQSRWRFAGIACATAGFAALSNAGYLAFGAALALGALLQAHKSMKHFGTAVIVLGVASVVAGVALLGRAWVASNAADNDVARLVFGVRSNAEAVALDPTAGRLQLLANTIDSVRVNPLGRGLVADVEEQSASAPVLWMAVGGYFALLLLLVREATLFCGGLAGWRRSTGARRAAQAWFALFILHISYGQWMNALYMTLVCNALVYATDAPAGGGKARA